MKIELFLGVNLDWRKMWMKDCITQKEETLCLFWTYIPFVTKSTFPERIGVEIHLQSSIVFFVFWKIQCFEKRLFVDDCFLVEG